MTFTEQVKNEIVATRPKKPCCRHIEAYGMVLFSYNNGKCRLLCDEDVARHYRSMIAKSLSLTVDITPTKSGKMSAKINDIDERFDIFGKMNDDSFLCEGCVSSFIRGAFIACGRISDPEKEYAVEFTGYDESAAYFLLTKLRALSLDAKICSKPHGIGEIFSVYLKSSTNIEDILTIMGAQNCSLYIMESKVLKDVRNNINRKTNFETSNIKKSSVSCAKQLEAINKLEKQGKLTLLPEELYDLALARRENIDISLSELGEMFGISKAGVHHRLKKIIEYADKI